MCCVLEAPQCQQVRERGMLPVPLTRAPSSCLNAYTDLTPKNLLTGDNTHTQAHRQPHTHESADADAQSAPPLMFSAANLPLRGAARPNLPARGPAHVGARGRRAVGVAGGAPRDAPGPGRRSGIGSGIGPSPPPGRGRSGAGRGVAGSGPWTVRARRGARGRSRSAAGGGAGRLRAAEPRGLRFAPSRARPAPAARAAPCRPRCG